ncbi:MAG: hypothetical protein QXG99_05935, partial [Conexivisphaerales archaeon]
MFDITILIINAKNLHTLANRDWKEYNEKLVNEPFDIFVNADLLINQAEQLKRMNEGKRGKP